MTLLEGFVRDQIYIDFGAEILLARISAVWISPAGFPLWDSSSW